MHTFEFDIADAFFGQFEYSLIEKGNVRVTLNLEKKETMMIGSFEIKGTVEVACDLCTEPFDLEIEGEYQLIFKFDDKPTDDETLIIVYPEEFELDLRDNLLELITVSLPSRTIHADGECNEEMLELLSQYRVNADKDDFDEENAEAFDEGALEDEVDVDDEVTDEDDAYIDPRWAALKKLGEDKDKK